MKEKPAVLKEKPVIMKENAIVVKEIPMKEKTVAVKVFQDVMPSAAAAPVAPAAPAVVRPVAVPVAAPTKKSELVAAQFSAERDFQVSSRGLFRVCSDADVLESEQGTRRRGR